MHDPNLPVVITCALTGVLTDPNQHPVPVTAAQMAEAAAQARDAGATVVHCHYRQQTPGMGRFPTWDPNVVAEIDQTIRDRVPDIAVNMSTGVLGPDLTGPVSCLERIRPELAALNAGSLNYLKTRSDGRWAWPPLVFDNPVEKIEQYVRAMRRVGTIAECECFDTGIVRSIRLFKQVGLLADPIHVSFVMGVASGMPCKPEWLPLLMAELPPGARFQTICIGQKEVWPVHRRCAELGGNLRTGLEDTFYLPNGDKTDSNGRLIEALVKTALEVGRRIATPEETAQICGFSRSGRGCAKL